MPTYLFETVTLRRRQVDLPYRATVGLAKKHFASEFGCSPDAVFLLAEGRVLPDHEYLENVMRKPPIIYRFSLGILPLPTSPPWPTVKAADPANFNSLVERLVDTMKVSRTAAEDALRASGNDLDAAANALCPAAPPVVHRPSVTPPKPVVIPQKPWPEGPQESINDQLAKLKPPAWSMDEMMRFYQGPCEGKLERVRELIHDSF
jgi:hypothetical protein